MIKAVQRREHPGERRIVAREDAELLERRLGPRVEGFLALMLGGDPLGHVSRETGEERAHGEGAEGFGGVCDGRGYG